MKKNLWRLIIHEKKDPYFNMAVDEAISKSVAEGLSYPTLRFYLWEPATLSLGYFQRYEKEIDENFCHTNNISLVRRITGGRAVLHDDEITYSVSIPSNDPLYEKNLIESYKLIAEALAEGLKILNLNPSFCYKKLPAEHSSAVCFDAPSIYEITIEGKKIIGSAQKRFQNSFLQHGSIPFSIDVDKLFNCFKFENSQLKERLKNSFLSKATAINLESKKPVFVNEAIEAIIEGFRRILNIDFLKDEISEYEKKIINENLYEKYKSMQWLKKY